MPPTDLGDGGSWRWSISRSRTLHVCPKAFEFGLDRQSRRPEPETRTNLSSIVGVTVHEAIRQEIDHWATRQPVSATSAQEFAESKLKHAWFSQPNSIVEKANGFELDAMLYSRFQNAVRAELDRFFRMIWPQFAQCTYEQHEILSTFELNGYPMAAKVDLAVWDESDRLLVVDWKTGQWAGDLADRAQLAFYTLWARSAFNLELERIRPVLVKIRSGEIIRFEPREQDLDFILGVIAKDFENVSRMEVNDDFPPSPERRRCVGCVHLRQCDAGMALTGLGPSAAEASSSEGPE